MTTFQDSSPYKKSTSLASPKQPPPLHPTPTSTLTIHPHHFTSPLPTKKLSRNTPQSPLTQQRYCLGHTPTSTTPSIQLPSGLSPSYTNAPWQLAKRLTKYDSTSNNYKPKLHHTT